MKRLLFIFPFMFLAVGAAHSDEQLLRTRRVFFFPDTGVSVMHGLEKMKRSGETDAQFYDRVSAKVHDFEGVPFKDVVAGDLPATRKDRNHWRWRNNSQTGQRELVVDQNAPPLPPRQAPRAR